VHRTTEELAGIDTLPVTAYDKSNHLIQMNAKRTHDEFYAHEDHLSQPKEYFKAAFAILNNHMLSTGIQNPIHLDIGCAAGDFLKYLCDTGYTNPSSSYGIDVMPKLLTEASARHERISFSKADISLKGSDSLPKIRFDSITMLGVHSIFDNLVWLDNISTLLGPNGVALVFGIFNPYDYDVFVKARKFGDTDLESGWNVISKTTIANKALQLGLSFEFRDFDPGVYIAPKEDKLRTWTLDISPTQPKFKEEIVRSRLYVNATRIVHDFSFCIIHKT